MPENELSAATELQFPGSSTSSFSWETRVGFFGSAISMIRANPKGGRSWAQAFLAPPRPPEPISSVKRMYGWLLIEIRCGD